MVYLYITIATTYCKFIAYNNSWIEQSLVHYNCLQILRHKLLETEFGIPSEWFEDKLFPPSYDFLDCITSLKVSVLHSNSQQWYIK